MTLEQLKEEGIKKLDELYHKLKMSIPEKDYVKLEQFLLFQIEKASELTANNIIKRLNPYLKDGGYKAKVEMGMVLIKHLK